MAMRRGAAVSAVLGGGQERKQGQQQGGRSHALLYKRAPVRFDQARFSPTTPRRSGRRPVLHGQAVYRSLLHEAADAPAFRPLHPQEVAARHQVLHVQHQVLGAGPARPEQAALLVQHTPI